MRPAVAASITAAMLEPRPDIRIVMRFNAIRSGPLAATAKRLSADERVRCAVRTRDDLADVVGFFTRALQRGDRGRDIVGSNGEDHADAAIEDAMHLVVRDATFRLQPVEHRRTG